VDDDDLRGAAAAFRAALEEHGPGLRLRGLHGFPKGACGHASRLLGQYFRDGGLGEWDLVSAWTEDHMKTHAWLLPDGLLVDITADQFPGVAEPVVVARASAWHDDAWAGRRTWSDRVGLSAYRPQDGAAEDYALLRTSADGRRRHDRA
jgi:hypothetical protein